MTEVRFHSNDPKRPTRITHIGSREGFLVAAVLMVSGNLVFFGLMGAPDLVSDLGRSADRLAVWESARIGEEAFASVRRRYEKLSARFKAAELFLERVAFLVSVPLPPGITDPPSPARNLGPDQLEAETLGLGRRLRAFELLRRAVAERGVGNAAWIPALSPVEPSAAVPVVAFGPRVSSVTHVPEFFPGIVLAAPEGTPVVAPAGGTILYAGQAPAKAGATWRTLGKILVIAHGDALRTVYGHLGKTLVRPGQRVQRGDRIALVGRSGFAAGSRLHYEVRKLARGRFLPVDPRLFILDADWITSAEIQALPSPPPDLDLPLNLR